MVGKNEFLLIPAWNELSQRLNEAERPTFVDLEKIRIGDNWKRALEKTIKNANGFLFILDNEILMRCVEISF